jgi:fatty aldehyde-generating acyl-ACP reductase
MKTFAFLFHPTSMRQIKHFWPITTILPSSLIKTFLKSQKPKIINIKKLRSITGKEIDGTIMVSPVLPENIMEIDEESIIQKIVDAGTLAKSLGAHILGLDGYFASIADKKPMIYKHVKIAVTSGMIFTAWSIFEAIYLTTQIKKIDLKKCTITIFGPNNAIGSLCSRKFAEQAAKIILTGGITQKLDHLKESIQGLPAKVIVEQDSVKAITQADIVINCYNGPSVLFDIADLKPGAIVCDAAVFKHIAEKAKQRTDLTVIDCGSIKLPLAQKLTSGLNDHDNLIYAHLAETIMLALEEKFINFSLGEQINLDKLEDIANIAVRHGFEVNVPELQ